MADNGAIHTHAGTVDLARRGAVELYYRYDNQQYVYAPQVFVALSQRQEAIIGFCGSCASGGKG